MKRNLSTLTVISVAILSLVAGLTLLAACSGGPQPVAGSDPDLARQALMDFFTRLHAGQYAGAAGLYGGDTHVLAENNPDLDPQDTAGLWRNACTINGFQCLQVGDAVLEETVSPREWVFLVEFTNPDGSAFVRGPCCGEEQAGFQEQTRFPYRVIKDDEGVFLVMDLPVYVP
ncbi:MAG: hypothetical protein ABIJ39_02520 [Chloroflexota bacterium]